MDEKSKSAKFMYHCIPPDFRIKIKQVLQIEAKSPIILNNEARKNQYSSEVLHRRNLPNPSQPLFINCFKPSL